MKRRDAGVCCRSAGIDIIDQHDPLARDAGSQRARNLEGTPYGAAATCPALPAQDRRRTTANQPVDVDRNPAKPPKRAGDQAGLIVPA